MNFLEAVKAMKEGKKVTRPNWSGYIYMKNRRVYHSDGEFKNTAINQFEATDWEIYDYNFDTLFKKLAIYSRREGLNHVADFFETKKRNGFFTKQIESYIVTDEEIAQLEAELKKLKEKDTSYGSIKKSNNKEKRITQEINKRYHQYEIAKLEGYIEFHKKKLKEHLEVKPNY